jgi:hypothetical protein
MPEQKNVFPVRVVEDCSKAEEYAKELSRDDRNGLVLRGGTDGDLLAWALKLSQTSEPMDFFYYENYGTVGDETFLQQIQRELADDMEGITDATRVALTSLLERTMHLFELATQGQDEKTLRWKVKFEVNQEGACVKYHDDSVTLRAVCVLTGDGTVLADSAAVDWQAYQECGGMLQVSEDDDYTKTIRKWNKSIVSAELSTGAGDLTLMKGGASNAIPCLHRAPFSADACEKPRFLITVDRVTEKQLKKSIDMEMGASDDDAKEEEPFVFGP